MKIIPKDKCIFAMGPKATPALRVSPGEQVQFETLDAFAGQITKPGTGFDGLDWSRINPATGPLYIEGAEPGDILSVRIDKIDIAKQGVIVCGKDMGATGALLEGYSVKVIPIEGEYAIFSERVRLPLNKMVGVIGTAPADEEIPTGSPDYHGGNMDCKEVKEGVTLLLPVHVPGAMLALGDLHAVMADGEAGISGLEVSGLVTVTVDVIKGKKLPLPMIETAEEIMTIASHKDLDIAVEMAIANMVEYLQGKGFDRYDSAMLVSLAGQVCICQVVDPKKTARVVFPRRFS